MRIRILLFAAILLTAAGSVPADLAAEQPTSWRPARGGPEQLIPGRLEQQLLKDAADGELNEFTLWQAAIVASGSSHEQDYHGCCERFELLSRRVQVLDDPQAACRERARRIFEFMHREVLTGAYEADFNNFADTLSSGQFNCVTATALFQALCQSCGLTPQAVAAPAHVYSRLSGRRRDLDIETTCPTWFQIEATPAARPPQAGRVISDVQLLGKMYYNQGVQLLAQKRFSDALQRLEISLILDPHDPTAASNRLAAINNWALSESQSQRYESAASLLQTGMRHQADYQPFLANDLHIHQKWAQQLYRKRRYLASISCLEGRRRERPDVELFDRGRLSIYRSWLRHLVQGDQFEAATAELQRARRLLQDHPEIAAWEQDLVQQRADELHLEGRSAEAQRLLRWLGKLQASTAMPSA